MRVIDIHLPGAAGINLRVVVRLHDDSTVEVDIGTKNTMLAPIALMDGYFEDRTEIIT